MAWSDLTIDQLNAVSSKYFDRNVISDQVYDNNVLLSRIREGGRVKTAVGGTTIHHVIKARELGQAKMIDPDTARESVVYDTRTALILPFRYAVCEVVMTWEEARTNAGDAAIVDLQGSKYKEGTQDMEKLISTQFYQAYASKGALDMDGFFSCVQTSGTTYGEIDADNVPAWDAGLYDTSTTTLSLYGTGSIDAGLRACRFRTFPNLMVTTYALSSIYASKLQPGERRAPENGRAGATDLYFQGIPIIADPQCGDDDWLFLDTDEMWFYADSRWNFNYGPWEQDPDRYEAVRACCKVVGNFVFAVRRKFGAYTAITS